MQILTHICCAPCSIYPLQWLKNNNYQIYGYFFNPNIHPYREFKKRIGALDILAAEKNLRVEIVREYGLVSFLRKVVYQEHKRCGICVEMRLEEVALKAKEKNIPAFTTTLLYSKYQNHHQIRDIGERLAQKYDLLFMYACSFMSRLAIEQQNITTTLL